MAPLPDNPPSRAVRYARFIERRAVLIVLGFCVVTALAGYSLRRLELRTSFEDLLPEGQPSVVALRQIMKRVGGMGTLNIAIESPDKEANKRFADALIAALRTKMQGQLHSIDYTAAPIRDFYQKNGILYLSVEELRDLDRALADSIRRAKLKANPLYMDVEEGERAAADPAKRVREIEARARARAASADKFPEGYYIGENGKLLAIFLRPNGSALAIHGARDFIARMQSVVDELRPAGFHKELRVGFTGSIKVTVEEHEAIARDLAGTSLLCVALVCLAVWLYFRQLRVLALLSVTLVGGAVWAFAIAAVTEGFVNAQTAFLGSIIVGTGINYGIMILARYLEERRGGVHPSAALATSLGACFKPTLVAALGTGVAFGVLVTAHIKSFSQFGLIGGVGIVLCWLLSYSFMPALLSLMERVAWLKMRAARRPRLRIPYPVWLARLPVERPWAVTAVFAVLVAGSLVATVRFLPDSLETDVNKLRNKTTHSQQGTNVLDNRVSDMMGQTLTPAVVLADDAEQARRICAAFERVRAQNPARPVIEWCRTIHSFLPERQEEKLAIAASIRARLARTPRDLLPAEVRTRVDDLRRRATVSALGIGDLPDAIRRRFRDKNGTEGVIALVAAGEKLGLYNINDLYAFTDALREIRLDNGQLISSSGDQVVFADILRSIGMDAPKTTVLAAAGVLALLLIVFRRRDAALRASSALGAGMALMTGFAAVFGIKLNFLNFVAIPTTLGIGVDYPVNVHERYHQDGPGSLVEVLRRTGPAVFVAALTTIIGYAVLMTSNSGALVSFGKLAVVGEVTCLAAALLLLPAIARIGERRAERRTAAATASAAAAGFAPTQRAA